MGPALLGASCERGTVSTSQQETSGERPAAQRAGAPRLAALPSLRHSSAGGRAGYRANEEEGYFSILLLCTQPGSEARWCRCPGQR